jgi:hypothetical protein
MNFITSHHRMLLLVAPITQVEIKVSDVIATTRVDAPQTLLELLIALAVQPRKVVVVLQPVSLLARRYVVAVVVIATAPIDSLVIAQVFVLARRVAWAAPLCARKAQVYALLCRTISLDRVPCTSFIVVKRGDGLQRVLSLGCSAASQHENCNDRQSQHFTSKVIRSLTSP